MLWHHGSPSPVTGTTIAAFRGDQIVDINWSLDQAAATCAASALGGPTFNRAFSPSAMARFSYVMWLEKAGPLFNTVVNLDNLLVEERQ